MADIVFKQESYEIIGACFEVYNEMGGGFLENVYQECLAIEFRERSLPFVAKQELQIAYKRRQLKCVYMPDFVSFDQIIVELKALAALTNEHRGQVHNYLKASGHKLGLLINFGNSEGLQYERIVR